MIEELLYQKRLISDFIDLLTDQTFRLSLVFVNFDEVNIMGIYYLTPELTTFA